MKILTRVTHVSEQPIVSIARGEFLKNMWFLLQTYVKTNFKKITNTFNIGRHLGGFDEFPPQLNILLGHSSAVRSVAFSPDGKQIVSGSDDKSVRVWDAVTGTVTSTLQGHSNGVMSVQMASK